MTVKKPTKTHKQTLRKRQRNNTLKLPTTKLMVSLAAALLLISSVSALVLAHFSDEGSQMITAAIGKVSEKSNTSSDQMTARGGDASEEPESAEAISSEDTSEEEGTGNIIIRNSGDIVGEDDAMDALFSDYMTTWFDALSTLQVGDTMRFFDTSNEEGLVGGAIDQEALAFLCGVRGLQSNDLSLQNYRVGITYESITSLGNGEIEVVFYEDHCVNFAFTADVDSYSSGIEHTFVLQENGDTYRMLSHEKDEDGYVLIQEKYESQEGSGDPTEVVEAIGNELLSEAETAIAALNNERLAAVTDTQENGNSYDRQGAVDYAMAWTDPVNVVRNEADWLSYDTYGGNCNNFISQCLFAGGIPMDTVGSEQWKWYGEALSYREEARGRSQSWAGVDAFYDYAEKNTGTGLIADTSGNVYSGTAGDVLQYGADGEWRHSVIVTDVVYNDDGSIADYLINSNTTDRINYPASAYAYSELRIIKILGYNV